MLTLIQNEEFENKLKIKAEKVNLLNVSAPKLKEELRKSKGKICVFGGDEKVNRIALESKKVSILLNPELNVKEDHLHYRRSGLNQVLCKLARENNIAIGFDFSLLLRTQGEERGKLLGRMFFNYKLCKKYKVNMVFSSFARDKFELRSGDTIKVFERILEKYSKSL